MLPSRLQQIRERSVAAVDVVFAEPVMLIFMSDGAKDPDRVSIQIDAVLRVGGGKDTTIAPGSSRTGRMKLSAGKAELHINSARYDGPSLKLGDRIRALSRRGQPRFEILRVDDRGDSRLVLELGEE